jgi:uncharacterized protein (DUF433 family)
MLTGTRIKVVEIALDHLAYGWDAAEIQRQFPQLSLGQIHSALAYYCDHKAEMDAEIQRRREAVPHKNSIRAILPALTLVGKYLAFMSAPRSLRLKRPKVVRVVRWIPHVPLQQSFRIPCVLFVYARWPHTVPLYEFLGEDNHKFRAHQGLGTVPILHDLPPP